MAGQNIEHQRVVFHAAGHGTDVVQGPANGNDPIAADQAEGGLHPHHIAQCGRVADGV